MQLGVTVVDDELEIVAGGSDVERLVPDLLIGTEQAGMCEARCNSYSLIRD